jgi:hypothetical protein
MVLALAVVSYPLTQDWSDKRARRTPLLYKHPKARDIIGHVYFLVEAGRAGWCFTGPELGTMLGVAA